MALSLEQGRKIAKSLLGTLSSGQHFADRYEVGIQDIVDAANRNGVAVCLACGWWAYDSEFDQDSRCDNCQIK